MSLEFDVAYRALQARDSRFDGLFFVGVATTGIYCRPVCPARKPKASSCTFFAHAATAENAGFRPCLRCRPELAPPEAAGRFSLAQALFRAIQDHALSGDALPALQRRTGYSPRQLRRLIHHAFGVTPVAVAQTQRLLFAKKLLQETHLPITQIALDAGFRSLRRFNDLFVTRYQLAPQILRRQKARNATDEHLRLRLVYRPPFAWREMLNYLRFRAIPGVELISANNYTRTFEFERRTGWLSIQQPADHPERHCLEVSVAPEFSGSLATILQKCRDLFDLDANPQNIASHLQSDPALAPLIAKNPGLRVPGAWNVFELSVRAILGQQISVAGATTMAGRLNARFGSAITTPFPDLNRLACTPETLAATTPAEIAAIGLPRTRAQALHGLAVATISGKLDFPTATTPEIILAALQALPGIGPWTANYIAMRALRLPDAFPTADLGLLKAMSLRSGKDLDRRSEIWRPWRAYATLHLWQSLS